MADTLQESVKVTWLSPILKPSKSNQIPLRRALGQQQKTIHLTQLYVLLGISVSLPNRGKKFRKIMY